MVKVREVLERLGCEAIESGETVRLRCPAGKYSVDWVLETDPEIEEQNVFFLDDYNYVALLKTGEIVFVSIERVRAAAPRDWSELVDEVRQISDFWKTRIEEDGLLEVRDTL